MEVSKKYYKYLDVIRIFFCLGILLYHLGILKGGYLAVCSFFTLSGYLSCISAFYKEKFSLKSYYKNRILKIYLPLLLVVFLTVLIVSGLENIIWLNLKPEVTSIVLGYNNFWQLSVNMDYFAHHINSPFMHLWYISILMQFDLVFPFIYLLLKKIGDKLSKIIPCIITLVLSIIGCLYFYKMSIDGNMMFAYYNTFARLFSIMFGLFLGFVHIYYKPMISKFCYKKNYSKVVFYAYLVMLTISFFLVGADSKYFEISMILATIVTCRLIDYSVILVKNSLSANDEVIKWNASICYEVYLVQYPVIFLFQYITMDVYLKLILVVILIILFSYLVYYIFYKSGQYRICQYMLQTIMLIVACFGGYKYVVAKDYTADMKNLEQQLAKNEIMMQTKRAEYEQNIAKEKFDLERELTELENGESQLDDVLTKLNIVGVGDSVMLGATPNLYQKFPNGYFDAKVSRTAYTVNDILLDLENNNMLGEPVILNLGANGDCPEWCKDQIMNTLSGRKVFWINVTNDIDVHVNDALNNFALKYDNLYIVDWASISKDHGEYFVADGIHLTGVGREAYTNAIYDAIYNVYLEEYKLKKEAIIRDYEEELKSRMSFFGNDILLNVFDELQNDFSQAKFILKKDFSFSSLKEELEKEISDDSLTYKIVFAFDNSVALSQYDYQELIELCNGHEIYIVSMNELVVNYLSSLNYENVMIINFNKEVKNNSDYLMADRVHLTEDGNFYLLNIFNDNLKS